MAHIFSLASPAPAAYREGRKHGDQVKFPDTGFFHGFNKPSRLEADIFELETTGTVSRRLQYIQNFGLSHGRYPKISMARSFAYSRIIAFRLYSKKTYTSMGMVPYLLSGLKTAMSTFGNDTYTPIASKQRQKPGVRCSVGTGTPTPTTRW
jgi:hypothetical protein